MPQFAGPVDDYERDDGPFVEITWQRGTVQRSGPNGAQPQDVIAAVVARLRYLNARVPCRENSLAITKLEEAGMWLDERTRRRQAQGVEATEKPHEDS